MASSTTLSVRVSHETRDRLERLAQGTRRTKSFLAAEAIDGYVARELEILEGIERGLADMRAGRLIPHEEGWTASMQRSPQRKSEISGDARRCLVVRRSGRS